MLDRIAQRSCWGALLALVLIASSCGSDINEEVAASETATTAAVPGAESETTAEPATTTTAPAAEAETTAGPAPTTVAPATPVEATSHLFGGFTFEYPSNHVLRQTPTDTFFSVFPDWDPREFGLQPFVGIAWVSRTFGGQPVASVEDLIEIAEVAGGGEVTEGDEAIDVFGLSARRFEFRGVEERPLFGGRHLGFAGESWWTPANISDAYLADLGDSVLVMWAEAATADEVEELTPTLRQIAASMQLLGSEIPPIPVPEQGVAIDFGPPPDIEPAERRDNGISTFTEPMFPAPASRFQFHRLGPYIEMTLAEDVFVPRHREGFIGIGDVASMGPYQLDLRLHMAMAGLVPMGAGPVPIGEPLSIDTIETLLDNPPPNLEFTNVELDAEIGGQPGISFNVSIIDSLDCGGVDKPCNYAFMGPLEDFSLILGWGHVHKVWLVENLPNGPLLIMASGPEATVDKWMLKADEMISGMIISAE